jgi:xanthine dehydrogenase/oxidase
MKDAIAKDSFFAFERQLKTGNVDSAELKDLETIEGTVRIAGQEHFYLETQCSIVVPKKEDDEIEIFTSCQHPSETQHSVAHILGIDSNRVTVRVKRLGGGFGGKESRSVYLAGALAVAAYKLKVPIRCMLTREEDMATSGINDIFIFKALGILSLLNIKSR